jgi:nucleoid-associated protein YgaU
VTPIDSHDPPPSLADTYPELPIGGSTRWGTSMQTLMPVTFPREDTPATHKIVDGDTLAGLAERFLKSASRAAEIFEANRDVLAAPEPLPIGVELKIPRHEKIEDAGKEPQPPELPATH